MQNVGGDIGNQKATPSQLQWRDDRKARLARMQTREYKPPAAPAAAPEPAPAIEAPPAPPTPKWPSRADRYVFSFPAMRACVRDIPYVASAPEPPAPHYPTIAEIKAAVAAWSGLPLIDIDSHRRDANAVRARQMAIYLARRLTTRSYPFIARQFGGRDHSTCHYAVHKMGHLRSEDAKLDAALSFLEQELTAIAEPMEGSNG